GLWRRAVGPEEDFLVAVVRQLQLGPGLHVDDTALRNLDLLGRLAQVHGQHPGDDHEGLLLDRVAMAAAPRQRRIAPESPARVLQADLLAEPGDVAGAPARLGFALDPVDLVGAGHAEGHGASLAVRPAIAFAN